MKKKNKQRKMAAAAPDAVDTAKSPDQIREKWLAICREAGRKIDLETAEVMWVWGEVDDPYGMYPEPSGWCRCIGRNYFARYPESDIWVSFEDLPSDIVHAFWEKRNLGLGYQQADLTAGDAEVPF